MMKIYQHICMLRALMLVLAATVLVSCADESELSAPAAPQPAEREQVPLSMALTLGDGDTRVGYTYDSENKKLSLSWSEKDQVGVYIKTKEGLILRAGALINTDAPVDNTCVFKGLVAQKFDGEKYIYMHPDLGMKTYIDFENQYGYINSTDHLNDYLPIVWRENDSGSYMGYYMGYVLKLNLTFSENPGTLKKVSLVTLKRDGEDRIFPRNYNINKLGNDDDYPFGFDSKTAGYSQAANNGQLTSAISFNVVGTGAPTKVSDSEYTAEVYLVSSTVKNLDVYNTKVHIEVINNKGETFICSPASLNGQKDANSGTGLLEQNVMPNGTVRKMASTMTSGGVVPTIINYQYKVNSLLGMWNIYGEPYDPFRLIVYDGGTSSMPEDGVLPQNLKDNATKLRDRYPRHLSGGAASGTPSYTYVTYESQCEHFTGNTYILKDTQASDDHGTDGHRQDNTTVNNITITSKDGTEVFFTFLSEYAWWQNLIGYYHYPKDHVPESSLDVVKTIIFPNVSKPGHEPFNSENPSKGAGPNDNIGQSSNAPLKEFETVKLLYTNPETGKSSTTFPKDEVIGFFLMQDVKANGFQQSTFSLLNWNKPIYFTNTAWNKQNSGWNNSWFRQNTFTSADVAYFDNANGDTREDAATSVVKGVAVYGAMDDISKMYQATAWSAMLFAISTKDPNGMQTQNKAFFNLGTGYVTVIK